MKINRPAIFAAALALGGLAGCVGYQLGSQLPRDIRSVFVPTVVNTSGEPFVETEVTRALMEQIQIDGSLKIRAADVADAVLEVTVIKYDLQPIAFNRQQGAQAEEYRVVLTASVLMTRRVSGDVIVQYPGVRGDFTFEVTGDLSSSKRRALPGAADELARRIIQRIVEYWRPPPGAVTAPGNVPAPDTASPLGP
jgi:hypothetical protein